jgi:hypothetical protein
LGHDADHQCVVAMHDKTLLAFNEQTGNWSSLLDATGKITGSIRAAVTVDGGLLIASSNGVNAFLYSFNGGTGMLWEAMLPPNISPAISDDVFQVLGMGRFDNTVDPVSVKVFRDGDIVTPIETKTFVPTITGPQHLPQAKLQINVRDARSHQIHVSQLGVGGDAGLDWIESLGESFEII